MTQEYKDLLFQDLCGRLPYGVKCLVNYTICNETTDYDDVKSSVVDTIVTINQQTESYFFEWLSEWFDFDEFKPYLFPLSSMTEEQKKELDKKFNVIGIYSNNILIHYHSQGYWDTDLEVDFQDWLWLIDWLNKNHFDYRGLIEKGLAINATGLNIY